MPNPGALSALILAAALVAGCAPGVQAPRSIVLDGDTFGYHQYEGGWSRFPQDTTGSLPGMGYRPGLVITIMSRNGAPIIEADRQAARTAAQQLCETTRRPWNSDARGTFLPGGGLSFEGDCG